MVFILTYNTKGEPCRGMPESNIGGEITLKLETLTPLWTGGARGKADRIHETGLLGGMRWWYEAMVRGLGGEVCEENNCSFNEDNYKKSTNTLEEERLHDGGLCHVCQVFGATGWRRRFRVSVDEKSISNAEIQRCICAKNRKYKDNTGKEWTPKWYFNDPDKNGRPNTPKEGRFTIQAQSMDYSFSSAVVYGLIRFISDWAALGARGQLGFGVVKQVGASVDARPLYERLLAASSERKYLQLPSLKNIFLARIELNDAKEVDTFNLKYDLRRLFANNDRLRHFIMGTVKKKKMAAKIKMSRPYANGLIRVWGWVPEEAVDYSNQWDRDKVVGAIFDHLCKQYKVQIWREMGSDRDTVMGNNNDARKFLRSLLDIEEG